MTQPRHVGPGPTEGVTDGLAMGLGELLDFMAIGFGGPLPWPVERLDTDGITLRCPASAAGLRPGGTVSGPTMMGLADGVAYMVILSRIGPAALAVTTNLNINFLRRPKPADLLADARLLKLGRTLAVVDVLIRSELPDGTPTEPVAQATVTYSLALLHNPPEAHP